jgi:hypothetical protein
MSKEAAPQPTSGPRKISIGGIFMICDDSPGLRGRLRTRESVGDCFDEGFDGSGGGRSQQCFELCEELLDWVEVGAAGGKGTKLGIGGFPQ